jgi:hypothetical protein
MSTDTASLEQIIAQVQQLPPDDRLRLVQRVAETLLPAFAHGTIRYLTYGQFSVGRMSTEEDFEIAEWRSTDEELDGS